ncbi:MAG TPA: DUF4012 domain-containing protein, partial [Acidimicrobiales bacterium]
WPAASRGTAVLGALAVVLVALPGLGALRARARRRVASVVGAAAAVAGLAGVAGLFALALARPHADLGVQTARTAIDRAASGDVSGARQQIGDTRRAFEAASRYTDAWWAAPGLVLPGAGHDFRAVRDAVRAGRRLAAAGTDLSASTDPSQLRWSGGRLPVDQLRRLEPIAARAVSATAQARADLRSARSPWVLSLLGRRLTPLASRVGRAQSDAEHLMTALQIGPGLVGGDGPRRYFLAVETPAEARATGGFIGNYGEITADGGALHLDALGRTMDLNTRGDPAVRTLAAPADYVTRYGRFDPALNWQNVTMSPDFPTVATVIEGLYPQSGGRPVDGVVAVDPYGLADLLRATGPVSVPSWPVPLTADNAAHVLLFDQYVSFANSPLRVDFLGEVTRAVWDKFVTTPISLADLAKDVGPAVAGRHLLAASTDGAEQAGLERLDAAGRMTPVTDDYVQLVTQNASGNKIDWFQATRLDYRPRVAGDDLTAQAVITLSDGAPAAGLPPYIIGNALNPPAPPGSERVYVSLYTPWALKGATLDGRQLLMESQVEAGRHVYSAFVDLPSGGSRTITVQLAGRRAGPRAYHLDVQRQPAVAVTRVRTAVVGDAAWRCVPPPAAGAGGAVAGDSPLDFAVDCTTA